MPEIEYPITRPAMIEASRIPLPDADSQLKLKTAPSAVGLATTGGTRRTSLSRPGTEIFNSENPSMNAFVCGRPQTNTTTLRMIHGNQARRILSEPPAVAGGPNTSRSALKLSVLLTRLLPVSVPPSPARRQI